MNDKTKPLTNLKGANESCLRLTPTCLACIVAAGLFVAGLAGCINHKAARRWTCSVSMALMNYSDVYGHLPYPIVREVPAAQANGAGPPAGLARPLYSWRVALVPYLQSWHGAWDSSQPWNSPSNTQLMELSSFYTLDAPRVQGARESFPETRLLAITGPGTAFGDGIGPPMAVKDAPPATILVVETASSRIPWPAPGDFDIRSMPRTVCSHDGKGISSQHAGGFHVIFADENVWLLSDKVPFETLSKFFTTADAKTHDREQLLGPFVLVRREKDFRALGVDE
jgi:hypothetical protein